MEIDLDEYDPPDKPDFRRVGKGTPFVLSPEGKRTRYGRSSNGGKILDDESNLTDWKLRTVVSGAAQRPELMAAASVLDIDSNKRELREIAEKCLVAGKGERRAVIGTAVHAMFDHLDRGDDWTPPPNFADLCRQYEYMQSSWGFEVVGIELHCINDRFRLAGTLDRRYRTTKPIINPDGEIVPIGTVIVADHKTGKELEYAAGSYATQLAAYVDSLEYDVATDQRYAFDPPNYPDWALIIHADSAGTQINVYWVDIQAGRIGLELASEVKAWRRRDGLLTRAIERPDSGAPPVSAPERPDEHQGATVPPSAPEPAQGTRADYLRGRIKAVLGHSEIAAQALQRKWPIGIPGLKNTGHTDDQLDDIQEAIENVEAEYSIPFYPPFPADTDSVLRHPSNKSVSQTIDTHSRKAMIERWLGEIAETYSDSDELGGILNVVISYANLSSDEYSDADVETLTIGALQSIGLTSGIRMLGTLNKDQIIQMLELRMAIHSGDALLLFNDNGNPVVRVINKGAK